MGETSGGLRRHFGLTQAVALNVTQIVGAGVFATIPYILDVLPGPYALLAWLAAGALILVDGLIWAELGAALPGSGGSYLYLLECYGRKGAGRLMAFLFIWQFLLSGPLEIASGLIALATFSTQLHPAFDEFNKAWTVSHTIDIEKDEALAVAFGPARLLGLMAGVVILALLYRRIETLGRLTLFFWSAVLVVIGWVLVEGALGFDASRAFDFPAEAATPPNGLARRLGAGMLFAMYSYLGYYNICYVGDEVRDPGKTIPRAVLLSALIVVVLFAALHLAMLGTVSWHDIPPGNEASNYSLAAKVMEARYGVGSVAVTLVTLFLMASCFGSVFAGMLGYSRIPYGAARQGHFFRALAAVHPRHRIPHVSLLLIGGLVLVWSFFDLGSVISALVVTRILEQFVAQAVGLMLLRRREPNRPRPFRVWLYPLPCLLALAGWLYLYFSAKTLYIVLGLATLALGVVVYLVWAPDRDPPPTAEATS